MDISENSRMSVVGAADQQPSLQGNPLSIKSKSSLKMVSFPEQPQVLAQVLEEVINREDLTDEDRTALWFSTEEYQVLKQEARLESMACEREVQSKGLLDNVFLEKCKDCQDKLNQWVRDSPGRRGLERTANQNLGDVRQQAQFQAVMDVLRSQDEMLIAKGEVDPEEVRKVSLKATRIARHFARMMAKADALAADVIGSSSTRDLASDHDSHSNHKNNSTRRNSKAKANSDKNRRASKSTSSASINDTAATSSSSSSSSTAKKSSKEKKEEKKAKKKEKAKEKEVKQKASKEEKQKAKEEKQKAKEKEKAKGKDREDPKRKTSFKEKLRETKAGIIARIPRIA